MKIRMVIRRALSSKDGIVYYFSPDPRNNDYRFFYYSNDKQINSFQKYNLERLSKRLKCKGNYIG